MGSVALAALFVAAVATVGCGSNVGGGPTKAAGTRHRFRPEPGTPSVSCRDGIIVPRGHAERVEQCRGGRVQACRDLAGESELRREDYEIARTSAERACRSDRESEKRHPSDTGIRNDRICSCAAYGSVLDADRAERFGAESLALLDEGCVSGSIDACDEIDLVTEVCSEQKGAVAALGVCSVLRAQKRLHQPTPEPHELGTSTVTLPPTLRRCFVATPRTPTSSRPFVICLDPDRVTLGTSGQWEQQLVTWRAFRDTGDFHAGIWLGDPESIAAVDSKGLTVPPSGRELTWETTTFGLAPATPEAIAEARQAPRVEDVCSAAARCIHAVDRALNPPPKGPDAELDMGDDRAWPTSLRECRNLAARERQRVKSPPPACEHPLLR